MEDLLKALIDNYIKHSKNILAALVSDKNGAIIVSKIKEETEKGPLLAFISNTLYEDLDQCITKYNTQNSIFEIKTTSEMKYSLCSLGKSILITIANNDISDIELKVYSINIAEKVELIFEGQKDIDLKIPEIMKIFSKTKDDKFPTGEHSIKVIVVGDYKAGKSSIIKRIIENKFSEEHIPTVGFNVSKKMLNIEDTHIRFSIWDTGGLISQISPTKENIYKYTDAAFIIIDRTQPNNLKSIQKWYNDIKNSIPKSIPIIIVGTKSDRVSDKDISEEDIKSLAEKYSIPYISTSAKTGDNINEVFIELTHRIIDVLTKLEIHEIKSKYKQYYLNSDEIKALEDLENLIVQNLKNSYIA